VEAAKQLPGVFKATLNGQTLEVLAPQAETILAPMVLKANQLGVKIRSIEVREPNLETVFLQLTGRALRD
jgi:ABC-2 type transport system ATP-binding protein